MKLKEVVEMLGAKVLCGEEFLDSITVECAAASDLMSDVLAFAKPGSLLLTGLTNVQIVRTARMLDMPAIVFVRRKCPPEETISLAKSLGIPLLLSPLSMYESCGILYRAGLLPCMIPEKWG